MSPLRIAKASGKGHSPGEKGSGCVTDLALGGQGFSVNDVAEFGQDGPDLCHTSSGFGFLPCRRPARSCNESDCLLADFFRPRLECLFPVQGGLPEEAIIHFQEHLNQRKLLEALVLDVNVFPQYRDSCIRRGRRALLHHCLVPPGLPGQLQAGLIPGIARDNVTLQTWPEAGGCRAA